MKTKIKILFLATASFLLAETLANAQSSTGLNTYNAAYYLGWSSSNDLPFKINSTTFMTLKSSGLFGFGTTTPAANVNIVQTAAANGVLKGFIYTGALNTIQLRDNEIPSFTITTVGRQWDTFTTTLPIQREVLITQPTYSFVGASTITNAATMGIAGAPIKSTNATITNTHGTLVQAGAVSTATNSYGLSVNAQTGATNNYAAQFIGGNVGIGTAAPANLLDVQGTTPIISAQINSGTASYAATIQKDISTNASLVQMMGGSAYSGTIFGVNRAGLGQVYTNNAPLAIGSYGAYDITMGTNNTANVTIKNGGNVGIGTTAPGYKLEVNGTLNVTGVATCTAGAWGSDQQFKTNIDSISNALAIIKQLKPKTYYFDTTNVWGLNFPSKKNYGFVAQDLEQVLPELITSVTKNADVDTAGNIIHPATSYRAVYYLELIALLTKGVQEQQQKIDSLQSKATNQDSINSTLQNQIIANNTMLQNQLNVLQASINNCCNTNRSMHIGSTDTESQLIQQTDVQLRDVQSIVLLQNVPNPFKEKTTINYTLPETCIKAQLLFHNSQGKLIQSVELVGNREGQLNVFADDLSNGIYTYTLVVDGKIIETKKMIKQ